MKKLLFSLFILISSAAFGQRFTFNRVYTLGTDVKMTGTIIVTDTTITINVDNNPPAFFDVYKETSSGNFSQYYVIFPEGSMHQIRLTITNPVTVKGILKKNENGTLLFEHKDLFTNVLSSMIYYLIPE